MAQEKISLDKDYLKDIQNKGYFPKDIQVKERQKLASEIKKLDLEPMANQLYPERSKLSEKDSKRSQSWINFFMFGNFAQWGMFNNSYYVSNENEEEPIKTLSHGNK